MAVLRGKPDPILNDVVLCVSMGWTFDELQAQPARFIEMLSVYLEATATQNDARARQVEAQIDRLKRMKL